MHEDIKGVGRLLFRGGLVDPFGGSISVRSGDSILVVRQGANNDEIGDGDLVEVGLEPGAGDGGAPRDIAVHRAIYKRSSSARSVVMTNSPNLIAVSISDNKIIPQDSLGLSMLKGIPVLRAGTTISLEEVSRIMHTLMGEVPGAVAVKGFGCYAFAADIQAACRAAFIAELSCKVISAARAQSAQSSMRRDHPKPEHRPAHRSAIPPGIGVMDRRDRRRFGR